jgi:hypothetical protein
MRDCPVNFLLPNNAADKNCGDVGGVSLCCTEQLAQQTGRLLAASIVPTIFCPVDAVSA